MTLEQHASAVRRLASTSLHYEACEAATARRALDSLPNPPDNAVSGDSDFTTPVQASLLQRQRANSGIASAAPLVASSADYLEHATPAVRMAATREGQAQSARTAATTVVVMSSNSSKLLQWKAGDEKDCKGFYWSTKLAVQQAWEQYNTAEDVHNYRTFRSCIHCTMLPIICAELSLTRMQFDKISDAELIDRIDKQLKPSGPADYLIKMRQIKFDTKEPSTTSLLHRYRAFAEPFLQLLAEAIEAGCQINDESIKLAFKEQCRGSPLMMMWLQENRWTNASAAHQRIMAHLKSYNTLLTLQSMNGQAAPAVLQLPAPVGQAPLQQAAMPAPLQQQQQAVPPAVLQQNQPAQQPRPYYTPQQRADYKRLKNAEQQASPQQAQQAHQAFQFHPTPPQQQPNPLFQQPLLVNNVLSPPPAVPASYSQPGLDHRGPFWHPVGAKCRYTPCTSPFCQGCGEHGHSVQECKKRNKHANWNYSGYYSEQRPGQGPLVYDGPARPQTQFAAPAPAAAPPAFPTPFSQTGRPVPPPPVAPARSYTPVIRSNAASQHPEPGGAAAPQ
jgi:hypothetical protein